MKIEEVTKEELLSLKNIGEKVADMIITAREEHDGTLTKMQFMCLPLPKPSVKERIIKHQELVFSDNSGGVSVLDIDVSTDGKVKFTQAISDIDEVMKLKVTSSDVNEAAGVVSSQEIQTSPVSNCEQDCHADRRVDNSYGHTKSGTEADH